ncbi:MAG TPA: hypothetical protein VGH28_22390 [Polyangiaceae bacterium]|jgi:hypothetical protein
MIQLRWAKGGEAEIVAIDDDRVTLASTTSSPPGAYVDGSLVNDGTSIRIKVHGCKKDGERFRIDGRILDLSKSLRQQLLGLVAAK